MVGVPGRSKACVTCLKRKKRCDLEKPFCGTCRKARVECGGYHRPRIFINNTVDDHNKQLIKKERGTGTGLSLRLRSSRSNDSDSSETDSNRSSPDSGSDIALLMSLARSAYQTKYMDLWWRLYLPNGQRLPKIVTSNAMGGWLDAIHELHFKEPVLEKALVAMSVTAVGKQEDDPYLKEEGKRMYGKALQSMAVAMKDPKRATSDGILTAVRLFSFYESLFGQSKNTAEQAQSWQVHNAGDLALIASRSPYSFVSGYAHQLFCDGRTHLTMSCLRRRKRLFLADPEWKTIPWLKHEKTPRDHLIDVVMDMTALFEDTDIMKACPDPAKKKILRQQLIDGFLALKHGLLNWQTLHAPDYHPIYTADDLPDEVCPEDLTGAHLMTLFWATAIVACSNLDALCAPHGAEYHVEWDLDEFCGNIVRTLPFFGHPSMGLFRQHVAVYPMTVALHYICAAGPQRLVDERRILADSLYDPALAGVRHFVVSMKDDSPVDFLK
ncbi:hypothetical protein BJX63DRAFT_192432 [Aspergillus granulosus]|uniref:Zn(2)-C6 fungal-type domain-containing protein n=1 Tax=Aspergillus granulosus TaxID=176169 RepID=A0ABR4HHE5_9EURO